MFLAWKGLEYALSPPKGPVVTLSEASSSKNPRVFFDITMNDVEVGRIEMELFKNVVRTNHFRRLFIYPPRES